MSSEPFPDHGQDSEEPEGSGPLPAGEDGPDASADADGTAQGLYVCLPAEELTLAGFAQDGTADTMAPGPLLATVVHAITGEDGTGLKSLSDDQLIGIMSAARRMESRAAWTQMAAMDEFARRSAGNGAVGSGAGCPEFAGDQLAG